MVGCLSILTLSKKSFIPTTQKISDLLSGIVAKAVRLRQKMWIPLLDIGCRFLIQPLKVCHLEILLAARVGLCAGKIKSSCNLLACYMEPCTYYGYTRCLNELVVIVPCLVKLKESAGEETI